MVQTQNFEMSSPERPERALPWYVEFFQHKLLNFLFLPPFRFDLLLDFLNFIIDFIL